MQVDFVLLTAAGALAATALFLTQALADRCRPSWRLLLAVGGYAGFSLAWTYGCIALFALLGALPDALLPLLESAPPLLWLAGLWWVQRRLLRHLAV